MPVVTCPDGNDLEEALREISREISSEFSCARDTDTGTSPGLSLLLRQINRMQYPSLDSSCCGLTFSFCLPQVWIWTGPATWEGGSRRALTSRSTMYSLAAPSAASEAYKHSPTHTYTLHPTQNLQVGSFCQTLTPLVQCWIQGLYPKALKRCPLQSRDHPFLGGRTLRCSKTSRWKPPIPWQKR